MSSSGHPARADERDGVDAQGRNVVDGALDSRYRARLVLDLRRRPALPRFRRPRQPDGQGFAAFGQVIRGMDVVRKIQASPPKARPSPRRSASSACGAGSGRYLLQSSDDAEARHGHAGGPFLALAAVEQDTAAVKREIEALKAQQAEMQRELDAIRDFLQQLMLSRRKGAMVNFIVAAGAIKAARPPRRYDGRGFRLPLPVLPPAHTDDPAANRHRVHQHRQAALRLHRLSDRPAAPGRVQGARSRELCRRTEILGDARQALRVAATRDGATRAATGRSGPELSASTCEVPRLLRRRKCATPVKDNVARMETLGVDSTPTFLIGLTARARPADEGRQSRQGAVPFDSSRPPSMRS